MSKFTVALRRPDGGKNLVEVSDAPSFMFAREFVLRETGATACLALVEPVPEPQEMPPPEKLVA